MSPDHPLWEAALQTITQWPPSMKDHGDTVWPDWFRYLGEIGVDPLAVTPEQCEVFLGRFGTARARQVRRGAIRALYRAARDLGQIQEVPIPDVVIGLDHRYAHRLTDPDVGRIEKSLKQDVGRTLLALRARRDLLMVALAYAIECSSASLSRLTWADLDETGSTGTLRIQHRARVEWVNVPAPVLRRIEDFRRELGRRGVDVVPEDALLPALGKRIEWGWTLPERNLLGALDPGSVHAAFRVIAIRASIYRSSGPTHYFSHRWLLRDPKDLARVMEGEQGARPTVRMRRTPSAGVLEGEDAVALTP